MYKIIGTDGKQYGPVTADQLRQWLTQGRVDARTYTLAEGATEWKPLGTLPEFAAQFQAQHPPIIGALKPAAAITGIPPKTNGFATTGLVFGILSVVLCCCGFPFGILGIVFSAVALYQIRENPSRYEGSGQALAGLILSILSLIINGILLVVQLAMNPGSQSTFNINSL